MTALAIVHQHGPDLLLEKLELLRRLRESRDAEGRCQDEAANAREQNHILGDPRMDSQRCFSVNYSMHYITWRTQDLRVPPLKSSPGNPRKRFDSLLASGP